MTPSPLRGARTFALTPFLAGALLLAGILPGGAAPVIEAAEPPDDELMAVPVALLRAGDPLPGVVGPDGRVSSFRLRVRDVVIPYAVMGVNVMPGETVELSVRDIRGPAAPGDFRLRTATDVVAPRRPGSWRWTAPRTPGPVPLRVESPATGEVIHLNVFVLHPHSAARDGRLNNFRIGQYRSRTPSPRGFVEANRGALDLRVAPDFTLGQFMPKQPGNPAYMKVTELLVLKLQALLEEVRREGIPARTLTVMSGFRTPHYNRAIGNTTESSRHLWGDAADVFVDLNGNGRMDDLNRDGRVDVADARYLAALVERVEARGEPHVRPGGIGIYRANPVRGPFVHVDPRGHRARW
jgi:hypothetical protein